MSMQFFSGVGVNSLPNMTAGGYFDAYVSGGGGIVVGSSAGPFGGAALQVSAVNGQPAYFQKNLNANFVTLYYGQWWQLNAIPQTIIPVGWYDNAALQVYLSISTSGQISIYNGSNTLLATNVLATLVLGKYTFVELGVVFNGSTGSVELKFGGTDVITLTGSLNTAPSGNNHSSILKIGSVINGSGGFTTPQINLADLYICDSGGSVNNTFLGPGQSNLSLMTANDATQFTGTPNTSTSTWMNISNNPSLPADYNYSATATQQDTFVHAAVPGSVNSVLAVQLSAFCALDAAGSRTAQVVFKSGGTTAKLPASPASVSPGYSWIVAIEENDPNTSSPWTVSNLNAAKMGYYLAT